MFLLPLRGVPVSLVRVRRTIGSINSKAGSSFLVERVYLLVSLCVFYYVFSSCLLLCHAAFNAEGSW